MSDGGDAVNTFNVYLDICRRRRKEWLNSRVVVEGAETMVSHHCILNLVVAVSIGVRCKAQRIRRLGVEAIRRYKMSTTCCAAIANERAKFPLYFHRSERSLKATNEK